MAGKVTENALKRVQNVDSLQDFVKEFRIII